MVVKIKTLILGAKGMLGHALVQEFPDALAWGIKELDITDEEMVFKKIREAKPEIIINAAAYTDVDEAETNKEQCFNINAEAVKYIAKACEATGSTLIHISTDYVFDGKKEGYEETSKKSPLSIYGESKALAEDYILEILNRFYILRPAWMFGKNGQNFVSTITQLAQNKESIDVVNDQKGCPTYTKDLAEKIRSIINEPFGIYHITNSGVCSWYELAEEIVKITGLKCNINPTTSDKFQRPAQRPKYSILLNTKTKPLRYWQDALKEYLEEK